MSAETELEAVPKYNRYRSVRRVRRITNPEPAPELLRPVGLGQEKKEENDGHMNIVRTKSMSRYHRPSIGSKQPQPVIPPMLPRLEEAPITREFKRRITQPVARSQMSSQRQADEEVQQKAQDSKEREAELQRSRPPEDLFNRNQKKTVERRGENEEYEKDVDIEAQTAADQLAEQKRKDLARLNAQLEAAPLSCPYAVLASPQKDKRGQFFTRRKDNSNLTPPTTPQNSTSVFTKLSPNSECRKGIEQGGGGIVPQIDAPISAVNAGERRVLIRCKQSSINLPITPDTTPVDIIHSAKTMTAKIISSKAILLESYAQLGLERRIRKYEHIRDVMNSWDRDTQNALTIENSDSSLSDQDLEASHVPTEPLSESTFYVYYSQKPGKWKKCYITLQSSGQMFMSKKCGAKLSEKDVVSICHLSDFDIYRPQPGTMRKSLKPPKSQCYAIKSQQKAAMFLNTENFVHYFCTDDKTLAHQFYSAVQTWRSWYLVNRLGEGKSSKRTAELTCSRPKVSADGNPTTGLFKPLLNSDCFMTSEQQPHGEKSNDDDDISGGGNGVDDFQPHLHSRHSLPSRRNSHYHTSPAQPTAHNNPAREEGEDFAFSSLLGHTYSQRKRECEGVHHQQRPSSIILRRPESSNSAHNHALLPPPPKYHVTGATTGLKREKSQRAMPKPLLDFTPTFKEAPQWDKRGKGHGVKALTGMPLVAVANTPATMATAALTQTIFRRDDARQTANDGPFVRGGLLSGNSMGNGAGSGTSVGLGLGMGANGGIITRGRGIMNR